MAASRVEFHTGLTDKLDHACRLLRKASGQGAQVVVCGESAVLDRLDRSLWTFEASAFVPHLRLRRDADQPAPHLARTTTWLVDPGVAAPHHAVLINLGPEMVAGFEQFERVIELVGGDGDDLDAGRRRWRAYEHQHGLAIVHHRAEAGS